MGASQNDRRPLHSVCHPRQSQHEHDALQARQLGRDVSGTLEPWIESGNYGASLRNPTFLVLGLWPTLVDFCRAT
jgi:hypothetical protein